MLEPLLLSLELVAITVLIPSEFVIGGAYFPPLLIAGLFEGRDGLADGPAA